jgi:hypothetical protein
MLVVSGCCVWRARQCTRDSAQSLGGGVQVACFEHQTPLHDALDTEIVLSKIFMVSEDRDLLNLQNVSELFESCKDGQQFLFCCWKCLLRTVYFPETNASGFP